VSLIDRFLEGRQLPRHRPATIEPGERLSVPLGHLVTTYGLALVLPALTAAAMIPFRADHGATTAIVLVLPVLAAAVVGGTGPAITAALSAGLSFDVFLTEPYYHVVIDDPDDVVATVTLVVVALAVGLLSTRLAHLSARAATRRTELRHLREFVQLTTAPGHRQQDLAADACARLVALLDLRDCRWRPGYHGGTAPTLFPDGTLIGYVSELSPDMATLPDGLELPAVHGSEEIGRFVLSPEPGHVTSLEERLTAGAIATLFASALR
jgi:two-component system sensor histidine kinase KdpD